MTGRPAARRDELGRIGGDAAELCGLLLGRALVDERVEARDELLRVEALLAVLVDRRRRRRSSASRQASSTSMASRESPPRRWRRSSKTSSISCVSAAIAAKPIVALMPFSECAMRKISSIVSLSSGFSSIATTREVELLEVLAALGQEHREVLGGVHRHAFR